MPIHLFQPVEYVQFQSHFDEIELGKKENFHNFSDFRVTHLAGLIAEESGLRATGLTEQVEKNISVAEVRDCLGEWLAIAESPSQADIHANEYLVFGDSYGYSPLFFALTETAGLLLSDSLQGIRSAFDNLGLTPSLDLENYLATITATKDQFHNPTVKRTMLNEVHILPMDSVLHITANSIHILHRAALGGAEIITDLDEAIQRGIDFTCKTLANLATSDKYDLAILLSGGVDSRLILSMLTNQAVSNRFGVKTADPRDWKPGIGQTVIERDIQIANQLRQDHEMNWWVRGNRHVVQFGLKESLLQSQSFRSNFSYAFNPNLNHAIFDNPLISLRGGGGEILRSTSGGSSISEQISRQRASEVESTDHHALIVSWYLDSLPHDDWVKRKISPLLEEAINPYQSSSLEEILNYHYLNTRNRTHFGHARQLAPTGEVPLQPLSNSFFLRASQLINFEERKNGELVRKIFSALDKNLMHYPFESKQWTKKLTANPVIEISAPDAWKHSYDMAKSQGGSTTHLSAWQADKRGVPLPQDINQAIMNHLKLGFALLEDHIPTEAQNPVRKLHAELLKKFQSNPTLRNLALAKLESALEVFYPVSGSSKHITKTFPGKESTNPPLRVEMSLPSFPNNGWNNLPTLEFNPSIRVEGNKIVIGLNPINFDPSQFEAAYYLYQNGEKINQEWYTKETEHKFSLQDMNGTFHGKVFVRKRGVGRPFFSEITGKIEA